ncbi:hypothetical protein [Shimia abyssi]|uniref:Lipoprotein n=1 Tax=Shimia abyssi TaxID=1662395 RepID=A0A2P8FF94_9RHOB|nr:hypothetical protein [Shimia abyssi]PSL20383.1 hypothetical protein CLV88_10324 [Shimia abyssi]
MLRFLAAVFTALTLAACASVPEEVTRADVPGLTAQITALNPDVDPEEAARAARIAYTYPLELKRTYNVTDSPLVHNAKVNQGLRPRGLCWHWADDLEARLWQENFQTLTFHRAIANATNIRIQHSTVIIAAKGKGMNDGVVLDPWRYGGYLFWSPTLQDERYDWVARQTVFEERRQRQNR